jgi:polar amino acid transport system substrate-binding protein
MHQAYRMAFCVMAMTLSWASCAHADAAAAAKHAPAGVEAVQSRGVLRVGITGNAPWAFKDQSGQWQGLDIDLLREFAKGLGWKIQLVPTTWEHLYAGLNDDEYDVAAAGLSITPQRAMLGDFTDSYGRYDMQVVVNRQHLANVDMAKLEAGNNARIGVLKDTRTEATAQSYFGNNHIVPLSDEATLRKQLDDGTIDAFVGEAPLPQALAQDDNKLQLLGGDNNNGKTAHAFAVKRGNTSLKNVLDAWLIDADASGYLKDRQEFWIKGSAWVSLIQ